MTASNDDLFPPTTINDVDQPTIPDNITSTITNLAAYAVDSVVRLAHNSLDKLKVLGIETTTTGSGRTTIAKISRESVITILDKLKMDLDKRLADAFYQFKDSQIDQTVACRAIAVVSEHRSFAFAAREVLKAALEYVPQHRLATDPRLKAVYDVEQRIATIVDSDKVSMLDRLMVAMMAQQKRACGQAVAQGNSGTMGGQDDVGAAKPIKQAAPTRYWRDRSDLYPRWQTHPNGYVVLSSDPSTPLSLLSDGNVMMPKHVAELCGVVECDAFGVSAEDRAGSTDTKTAEPSPSTTLEDHIELLHGVVARQNDVLLSLNESLMATQRDSNEHFREVFAQLTKYNKRLKKLEDD